MRHGLVVSVCACASCCYSIYIYISPTIIKLLCSLFFARLLFYIRRNTFGLLSTHVFFIHFGIVSYVCVRDWMCVCSHFYLLSVAWFFPLVFDAIVIKTARQLMLMFVSYWVLVLVSGYIMVAAWYTYTCAMGNEQTLFYLSFCN